MTKFQPFHLVSPSPWPILMSGSMFILVSGFLMWVHNFISLGLLLGLSLVLLSLVQWWRDVVREGSFEGEHSAETIKGLQAGMVLFIASEVLFFFSFFWAFFHSSLAPVVELGGNWPPFSVNLFDPMQVPLLNTVILVSSGATVTWAHHSVLEGEHYEMVGSLGSTVALGFSFVLCQIYEYHSAFFSISDSVYGSVFFIATGFHGFHVIVGMLFLMVNLVRSVFSQFSSEHHLGLELAIWYWHFVDVVWLFLYLFVYWWGS